MNKHISRSSCVSRGFLGIGALAVLNMASAADTVVSESPTDDSGSVALSEVLVTAQKRSQNLQDVPISVNAFSASSLAAAGVTTTADLDVLTPGLNTGAEQGFYQPHLRGVGTTAVNPGIENPVALYIDGVYYSSVAGAVMSLNNVESIEVDKGPQGTLFGRNATGGLIQITTRDPSQTFAGNVGFSYGNYNTGGSDFYVSGGVTSAVSADFAGHWQDQGTGYGINYFNGLEVNKTDDLALRSKWIFDVSEAIQMKFIVDYDRTSFSPTTPPAPDTIPLGAPPYTGSPQGIDGYYQPYGLTRQGGGSLQVKDNLNFATFSSITAYRQMNFVSRFDGALTPDYDFALNIDITQPVSQFSQEFQLSSPDASRLKWLMGAYFFFADAKYDPLSAYGGLIAPDTVDITTTYQKTYSVALYGQATQEVAANTDLTLGVRGTYERRKFAGTNVFGMDDPASQFVTTDSESVSVTRPTWRIALDHKFNPDLMSYISYNRGFKSGGFNDVLVPTTVYQPETLDAFEVGLKSDSLNNRIRVNTAAFYYEYRNFQAVRYPAGLEEVFNAPRAEIYGLDLDAEFAATDGLKIRAGLEALHSQYTDFPNASLSTPADGGGTNYATFDAIGKHLPLAPDFMGDISVDYSVQTGFGKAAFNVTYAYNSGWFAEPDNRLSQGAYSLVNAQIVLTSFSKLWDLKLWGKNLGNTVYETQLSSQANGDYTQYAPPRTYGVTVEKQL